MSAVGNAQVAQNQGDILIPQPFVLPEESCCHKIGRIALQVLAMVTTFAAFFGALFVVTGMLPGVHLITAIALAAVSLQLIRPHEQMCLSDPEQRAELISAAEKSSFKELLAKYTLKQMLDYQILPKEDLKAKALRYLEEASLKKERISDGLLDAFVEEEFISEEIRRVCKTNKYPTCLKHILFVNRLSAERHSSVYAAADQWARTNNPPV